MNLYQILCLLGIPSLTATLLLFILRAVKRLRNNNDAVKSGLQALLRSEMIKYWNKYSELKYAPIYAKENFENCYRQYHSLGANGVMDNIYHDFMSLPTKERNEPYED